MGRCHVAGGFIPGEEGAPFWAGRTLFEIEYITPERKTRRSSGVRCGNPADCMRTVAARVRTDVGYSFESHHVRVWEIFLGIQGIAPPAP